MRRSFNFFRKTDRVIQNGKFIPELDGLRFIAIISVLLFHVNGRLVSRFSLDGHVLTELLSTGFFGVELFFAISGFILSHQYLRSSSFKYKSYLIRRIKRIEPPYIIAVVIQTSLVLMLNKQNLHDLFYSFLSVITYSSNFFENNIINGITWSLEIEVQFYLILPILLLMLRKIKNNWMQATIISATALLITFFIHPIIPVKTLLSYLLFFSVGIVAAIFKNSKIEFKNLPANALINFVLVVFMFALNHENFRFIGIWKAPLLYLMMLWLFINVLIKSRGVGMLRTTAITRTGGMCYTIYLWHVPVLSLFSTFIIPALLKQFEGFSLYLLSLFAMTVVSLLVSVPLFLLFEKPFMYRNWKFPWSIKD